MLRATARAHIPCDGRSLGRILATAGPDEAPEGEELAAELEARPPERSGSRVVRVVKLIGSRLPDLMAPLTGPLAGDGRTAEEEPAPAAPANGFGALAEDGRYVIQVQGDRLPPAPWSNVIANAQGGCLITERGGGFTWALNSQFYRLTPWHNDPVSDTVSEVVYLQDEETGDLWSATPGPVRTDIAYTVRHGPGATSFEHRHQRLAATPHHRHGRRGAGQTGAAAADERGCADAAAASDDLRGMDGGRAPGAYPAPGAHLVRS